MNTVFQKSHYRSIWHPIENTKMFCRHIKWSIQRIRRGYSDYDLGDIDVWFTETVPDMLEDFEKQTHFWSEDDAGVYGAHPMRLEMQFYEEHQEEMGLTPDEFRASPDARAEQWRQRCYRESSEKWSEILKEMAYLFRETDRFLEHSSSYPCDSSEYIEQAENYRDTCKDKAFAMFADWFFYLWN